MPQTHRCGTAERSARTVKIISNIRIKHKHKLYVLGPEKSPKTPPRGGGALSKNLGNNIRISEYNININFMFFRISKVNFVYVLHRPPADSDRFGAHFEYQYRITKHKRNKPPVCFVIFKILNTGWDLNILVKLTL